MRGGNGTRWGGLAGIGAVVLAVAGRVVLGATPGIADPTGVITAYLVHHRTRILCGAMLYAVAVVLLLWFGAALSAAFRRAGEAGDAPAVVFAGFVLVCTVGFVVVSAFAGATYALTANPALLLFAAAPYTALTIVSTVVGIAAALTLAATAAAITRTRLLPRWMAWFAALVGVVRVLAACTVGATGGVLLPGGPLVTYLPGALTGLWLLAAGGLLVVRTRRPPVAMRARLDRARPAGPGPDAGLRRRYPRV